MAVSHLLHWNFCFFVPNNLPYVDWSLLPRVPVKTYQQRPLGDRHWMYSWSISTSVLQWSIFISVSLETVTRSSNILQQPVQSRLLPQKERNSKHQQVQKNTGVPFRETHCTCVPPPSDPAGRQLSYNNDVIVFTSPTPSLLHVRVMRSFTGFGGR